jgi:hypothetical protein
LNKLEKSSYYSVATLHIFYDITDE